MTKKGRELFW